MPSVRITFASGDGPSAAELAALRWACGPLASAPIQELARALRGVRELIVQVDELGPLSRSLTVVDMEAVCRGQHPLNAEADRRERDAVARLASAGLRPEPITMEYGAEWIASELGCGPLVADEHRWTFMPSFQPELVVSAVPDADRWQVEVRRPEVSLWYATWRSWPPSVRGYQLGRSGSGFSPAEARIEAPRGRPAIDVERATATPRTSKYANEWLARMHGAQAWGPREVLDGVRAELQWRDGEIVHSASVQSPPRDDVHGRSLVLAGLALAGSVTSKRILDALDALAP